MSLSSSRLAYVDDEADIREIVGITFEMFENMPVALFDGGRAFLDTMRRTPFDVVMLDMMMPGMTGLEVLRTLRQEPVFAATPIFLVTAKAQPNDIETYFASGVTDVIPKPFDPIALTQRVLCTVRTN